MEYIVHHRFKLEAACGEKLNLPYGTKISEEDGWLTTDDGKLICYSGSENAKQYFANNCDGNGLERGKLTYAIAYGKRKNMPVMSNGEPYGFRFTEDERKMLERDYSHWLRQDVDTILFNDNFFNAGVDELQKLVDKLKIKV